jgi:iron complex outermembrane recepter protein
MRKAFKFISVAVLSGVSLPALAQSTPQPQSDQEVEVIVVTAQKRTENLIDVPISITAISGDALAASARNNVSDLQNAVPNLTLYATNGFSPNIIIRGFESSSRNVGFESSVGVYIDGVFMGRSQSFLQELDDIARLEVLRGPQGTLFGKNTTTGAVSITTRRPGNDFGGQAGFEIGNYDSLRANVALSGPLIADKVAGKVSAYFNRAGGAVVNVSGTGARDIERSENYGGRGELRFTPTQNLDIALRADYAHRDARTYENEVFENVENPVGIPTNSFVPGIRTVADAGLVGEREIYGASLTANYTFQNEAVLTAISAYRNVRFTALGTIDFSVLDFLDQDADDQTSQTTQEIRYASPDDRKLKYVIGAYYFSQNADSRRTYVLGSDYVALGAAGFNVPEDFFRPSEVTANVKVNTTSVAAFANGSYDITERLSLNAGLRYSTEKKRLAVSQIAPLIFDALDIYINVPRTQARLSDSDFSPTIGLAYKVSERINTYLRYSKGFKSGGWNPELLSGAIAVRNGASDITGYDLGRVQFKPESIDNYELGFKSELFDRKLRLNIAVFQQDYKDIQVVQFIGGLQGFATTNAGSARSRGFELELAARPTRGLDLSLGLGYSDARYVSYKNANDAGADLSGRRLDTPDWTVTLSGQYERPLTSGLSFVVGGDYSYRGERPGDPLDTFSGFDGFDLLDGRIGIESDKGWSVFVFGKNLLDADYLIDRQSNSTLSIFGLLDQVGRYGDPLTYGIRGAWKF